MGSLYRRGKIWWLKYYQDGRRCRETSGSISKREAEKLLRKREGAIASGTFTGIAPEKTTLRELGRDLLNDYKMNGKRTLGQVERYVNRLDQYFGAARVQQITTDTVRSYIVWRQASTNQRTGKKPSNASINRELSALRRMLNLGRQAAKVITGPHVPLLRENNVRQGFLHHHDYLRLMGAVPSYLRPVLSLASDLLISGKLIWPHYSGLKPLNPVWAQESFPRLLAADGGRSVLLAAGPEPRLQHGPAQGRGPLTQMVAGRSKRGPNPPGAGDHKESSRPLHSGDR